MLEGGAININLKLSHNSPFSAEKYNFTLGDKRDNILELNHTSILKASYRDVTFRFGIINIKEFNFIFKYKILFRV